MRTTDTAPAVKVKPPTLQSEQCRAVWRELGRYSGWDQHTMWAISRAESGCRPDAFGDGHLVFERSGRRYGYSVGAMQIRILPSRERCDSYSLATNIKCAYDIWRAQGYGAWTVYSTGKYKHYL